ncbi:LamG domain-containing protein [Actinomadura darangshiensis]|uniref:LamG domain-containing protein n=1 Tax=Actinomadura darangshiensis TaxID=705336 RepID=A0A4R5AHJ5_9ACTN|nr:LamG domain-containing protein [Actinomadura darangshiensis]TDD70886.1 LamG domain-containing protein [Actinomadura darangshiensis]
MRPRRTIPVLLTALAVAAPMSIAGSMGAALAEVVLPAPTVASADYPADASWHGGVGVYGDFTFDDPSDQAVQYSVNISGQPGLNLPTQDGAPVTVPIAPYRGGPVILDVQSLGPAGEVSPRTTYEFRVWTGNGAKAHWRLDEPTGARELAAETPEGDEPVTARAVGRVATGAEGQLGTGARLTGGHADSAPLVDTSKSFTVSAWARPTSERDSVVVAATGRRKNAFSLRSRDGHWAFVKSDADSRGAATTQAVAEQPVYPGTWAHLIGSYDATQKRLRLYVNGTLASDVASGESAWNAQGRLRIGAGVRPHAHPFRGGLDEVRVYDRIIVPKEAAELQTVPAHVRGRWKFDVDGADDSTFGNAMALRGGAAVDPAAGADWSSPAGLMLTGTGAYAETAGPVIRTDRSFTLSVWVDTERLPAKAATLLSLPGEKVNRLALRFQPGSEPGRYAWQAAMADSDSPDAKVTVAEHTGVSGSWDHLAVVYDGPTRTMTLYVNEQPDEGRSVKTEVGAFGAKGALQVGRSAIGDPEYWPGPVDDVWAFQGALTWQQISGLRPDAPTWG